ncbi:MAG: hypothetical protein J2P46_04055, partial [Zavarzinella sp.]|nr:hypothetical protein [Zavarzinella sp.]
MLATSPESAVQWRPVIDLLTGYLLDCPVFRWPGSDGMLVEDVLAGYEALAAAGHVPPEATLCAEHPELAGRLAAF